MKATKSVSGRRGFLLGAGAAGAAGAAVIATKGSLPAGGEAPKPEKHAKGGGGYHVTDHVRHYYRTTTV
ncbi:formate dehydrogenase [Burkholderiaceae bacterium FT117]|uniref:formate dehydrogenase n=1 Tax=Zeimonas sediminis TaxID=2944268 RepID=UPI0023430386|nr:formate dehydrogenase [Zeimonas sediminis]MCM5568991.1 formate dehydrogenase [Zeimonas sediminis]